MSAPPPPPRRGAPLVDDKVFSKLSATLERLKQETAGSLPNEKIICKSKTSALATLEEEEIEVPAKTTSYDDIWEDGGFVYARHRVCRSSNSDED